MQLEGRLDETSLVDLLRQTAALGKTGILTVQSSDDIIAVTFLEGNIVAADALNEPMDEGLGQVLVNQGLISASQFHDIHTTAKAEGERVSGPLVSQGLVGREQILQASRLQTYRLLLRLIQWTDGDFNLFVGDEISYEEGIEPISVPELLIRSINDLGEKGPLRGESPLLEAKYERSQEARQVRVLGRISETMFDGNEVWISEGEEKVLRQLEPAALGTMILRGTGLDDYHVQHALHRMIELGLVRKIHLARTESIANAEIRTTEEIGRTTGSFLRETGLQTLLKDSTFQDDDSFLNDTGAFSGITAPTPLPAPVPGATTGLGSAMGLPPATASRRLRTQDLVSAFVDVWMGRALAVALILAMILAFALVPRRNSVFFPYPWQSQQRATFEAAQSVSHNAKIDTAVRTYYLLYGRFPEQLGLLANLELLNEMDDRDGRGRYLEYTSTEDSYTLQPLQNDRPVPGLEHTRGFSSDFLLNPEFVQVRRKSRRPLVLLD
jgi:hypothetical protein